MIKYKYRIKTEQEFIEEFGRRWRDVGSEFVEEMNYLLGTEINIDLYRTEFNSNNRLDLNNSLRINIPKNNSSISIYSWSSSTWKISQEMIKEIKIGIDYNQKKVLVYD